MCRGKVRVEEVRERVRGGRRGVGACGALRLRETGVYMDVVAVVMVRARERDR